MAPQPESLQPESLLPAALGAAALSLASPLAGALLAGPAAAAATNFSCGSNNGVPATVVSTDDGRSVPLIRWTSNVFDAAGWTPERRCQEVSQRFETYRQQGRLTFITTGRINGLPVICTAPSTSANCDGLLYTLKPGHDPALALRRLLDVRFKARGPLNESRGRLYVSIDQLLSPSDADAAAAAPAPGSAAVAPPRPLW